MTQPQFDVSMIRLAIASGVVDDHIDSLIDSLRARQQSVGLAKAASLSPGKRLYISANVRPQLLAGAPCDFVGWEGGKVKVRLVYSQGAGNKWRAGSVVTLPPALIGEVPE